MKNASSADIKSLAAMHGKDALARLVQLMNGAESEQVKVAAAREILDRAYGKPAQSIVGDEDAPIKAILEVVWAGTSASNGKG